MNDSYYLLYFVICVVHARKLLHLTVTSIPGEYSFEEDTSFPKLESKEGNGEEGTISL
jgi:hypothetical protein